MQLHNLNVYFLYHYNCNTHYKGICYPVKKCWLITSVNSLEINKIHSLEKNLSTSLPLKWSIANNDMSYKCCHELYLADKYFTFLTCISWNCAVISSNITIVTSTWKLQSTYSDNHSYFVLPLSESENFETILLSFKLWLHR